jgi:heme-degrading monooxygenase HmoA
MHARLTRFEGSAERIDDAVRQTDDVWLPMLRGIDGFRGLTTLADRSTGTVVSITCWESADAMRASEEQLSAGRKDVADFIAVRAQPTIELYEVVVQAS